MSGNSWLRRMLGATHVPGTNMTQKEWDNLTPMQQGLFNRSDGVGQTVAQMQGDGDEPNMLAPGRREAMKSDYEFLKKQGVFSDRDMPQNDGNGFMDFLKRWFDSSKQ